ncbi:MAG: hypothetical protein IJ231_01185 [Clostridia bacterium]|nr:hypothetical protein [Clostridia bacterium]
MKKSARRFFCLLLSLCLTGALLPGFPALAESGTDSPLLRLYEAGQALLTEEKNFTVSAQADFLLDGVQFKHAEGLYAQEGENSYQQIDLESPSIHGGIRKNGYAVMDRQGSGYAIETYGGKDHIKGIGNASKEHALRPTVSAMAVLELGQEVARLLDQQMQDKVSAVFSDERLQIDFDWDMGDIPALAGPVLNLFYQEAVGRYLFLSYSNVPVEGYATIEDFSTVTQGILYTLRSIAPESLRVSAQLDAEGRLLKLACDTALQLHLRSWETRTLTVSFTLEAKDYGTTVMLDVVPEEKRIWNQKEIEGYPFISPLGFTDQSWADYGLPDFPLSTDLLAHETISTQEEAIAYAKRIAGMDVLKVDSADQLLWSASQAEETYTVEGARPESPDTPAFSTTFSTSGTVLRLENLETGLDSAAEYWEDAMDTDPYVAWRADLSFMLWSFEENLNPGATLITEGELRERMLKGYDYTGYEDTRVSGDEAFITMYGTLYNDPERKVKYVVQTAPMVRVVLRDATIDSSEGGNG